MYFVDVLLRRLSYHDLSSRETCRKCDSLVTGGTGKKPASANFQEASFGSAAMVLALAGL